MSRLPDVWVSLGVADPVVAVLVSGDGHLEFRQSNDLVVLDREDVARLRALLAERAPGAAPATLPEHACQHGTTCAGDPEPESYPQVTVVSRAEAAPVVSGDVCGERCDIADDCHGPCKRRRGHGLLCDCGAHAFGTGKSGGR